MRVRCVPVATLLSALLLAGGLSAQTVAPEAEVLPESSRPGEPADPEDASAPAARIAGSFDAEDYASRRQEMRRLWGDYRRSHEQVRELTHSGDAEVAQRARWILRRWEMGLLPDLPEAVQRQLAAADSRPTAALGKLIDGGYLREAVEVVRLQLGGPTTEEMRNEIAGVLASRLLGIVAHAKQTDVMDQVLELLEMAAETTPLAVARAVLIDRLGQRVDETNLLPRCASNWPPERRDEVATITLTVLGRFDEAIAIARRSDRIDLLSTPLLLDGRWAELAEVAHGAIHPNLPVEASLDHSTTWLLAARQAGIADQVDQAAEPIATAKDPAGQAWRALAVAGRFDAAIEVAKRVDPASAAELAAAGRRMPQAFEIIGVDPADPQPAIDLMIGQLSGEADSSAPPGQRLGQPTDLLEQTLTALQLLHRVGQREVVKQTLRRIAAIPEAEGTPENMRREVALLALRFRFQELVPELALGDSQELDAELNFYLGYRLGDRAPIFFNTVRAAIAEIKPDESPQVHLRAAMDLFAQRLPHSWDRHVELDALHAELLNPSSRSTPGAQLGFFGQNPNARLRASEPTFLAGDLFTRLGRSDLGLRWYQAAAEGGDTAALLHFAERRLAAGDAAEAASLYRSAYEDLQSQGSDGRSGFAEPINDPPPSAPAALAGQAVALRRLGQVEQSDAMWETLRLVPLNPVTESMRGYVEQLGTLGEIDRQREAAEAALRYAAFDRSSDRNFYSQALEHASRLSDADPAAASLWMRIGLFSSLPTAQLYASAYLAVPSQWHVAEALAAARRGDGAGVAEHLQIALDYHPLNIEMAEEDLPKIREAGFDDVADTVINRLFETGLQHAKQFGFDANTANNLAWVTTINGQNYEQALILARQAVFLVPDSVSYRDTLAEILFRLGKADEAIAIQRQCLLDEPDLWHIHEQIERFSEAAGNPDRRE